MNKQEFLSNLGSNIRKLRELKGLSQYVLSIKSDLSQTQIWLIENAKCDARIGTCRKIADALEIDIRELFREREVVER